MVLATTTSGHANTGNTVIVIDGGKDWRIESNPAGNQTTWSWEGGGKSGVAGSRKEAEDSAKAAAKEKRQMERAAKKAKRKAKKY